MIRHSITIQYHQQTEWTEALCSCGWRCGQRPRTESQAAARNHLAVHDRGNPGVLINWASLSGLANAQSLGESNTMSNDPDSKIRELEAQLARKDDEMKAFRLAVADTAMRYARQHDWCGVVQEALADVGVDPAEGARWYRLQIDVALRANPQNSSAQLSTEQLNNLRGGTCSSYIGLELNRPDGESDDHFLLFAPTLGEPIDYGFTKVLATSEVPFSD